MHTTAHRLRTFLSILLGILLIWQLALFSTGSTTTLANYWFNAGYSVMFIVASGIGFFAHGKKYISGVQGRALSYFSWGSASFAIALLIWAHAGIVDGVSTPFPSSADVFFIAYTIFVGLGCSSMLKLVGNAVTRKVVFQSVAIAVGVFIALFAFLIVPSVAAAESSLEKTLTLIYPGIACALMSLVLIAARVSGGMVARSLKLYFISLIFLAAGLVSFLVRHQTGSYWNGDISDFFCLIAGFAGALAAVEIGWGEA
jgi:hypothetical protein